MPELAISPEKVAFIIEKAREFDVKEAESDPDSGSNPTDDDMIDVLEDDGNDPVGRELAGFIRALNEDEQTDLVALMWLGRGDGGLEEWDDLRACGGRPQRVREPSPRDRALPPGRTDARRFPRRRPRRIRGRLDRRADHGRFLRSQRAR
jgi:hypothetical protein